MLLQVSVVGKIAIGMIDGHCMLYFINAMPTFVDTVSKVRLTFHVSDGQSPQHQIGTEWWRKSRKNWIEYKFHKLTKILTRSSNCFCLNKKFGWDYRWLSGIMLVRNVLLAKPNYHIGFITIMKKDKCWKTWIQPLDSIILVQGLKEKYPTLFIFANIWCISSKRGCIRWP